MKTTGNTIFISGGSAGIGLEIAKQFSALGNKVIINGRNKERLENALGQLNNAEFIQGDLSIESERERIAEVLRNNYPDINVLINNAGDAYAYTLNGSENAYQNAAKEINTNYLSIIHLSELLLPILSVKKEAAIVNVTSIVALAPQGVVPTYSSSKAALSAYTQLLRKAFADTGLEVYELMPPLVNTHFSADIGGANGIPPKEVADELLLSMENRQFDVPVGQTKALYTLFENIRSKLNC